MATIFPSPAPELPQFHTIVLCGPYHASAPIHLMLSHNWRDPRSKAIFISPSRATFLANLARFDDEWLRLRGGDGKTMSAAARIDNYYPPTPTHLALLLNMLHVYQGTLHHPKTTLPEAPSLLVLHELSALLKPLPSEPTLASYLILIMHALTTVKSLSAAATVPVALAVFDSGLDALKLPILRPVSPAEGEPGGSRPSTGRREPVAFFVEKYFEWSARVEAVEDTEVAPGSRAGGGRMRMVLHRPQDEDSVGDVTIEWMVVTRVAGPHAGARYFAWT